MRRYLLLLYLFSFFLQAQVDGGSCYPVYGNCWYQGFEWGAEWLYWKAEQGQMELASSIQQGANSQTSSVLRPRFTEENGYRIYVDYEITSCWVFEASYTHAPSHASVSRAILPDFIATEFISLNTINLPILSPLATATLSNFEATWDLDIDYFDLDFGRPFSMCNRIEINPHIGFRGFWMRQKLYVQGTDPTSGLIFNAKLQDQFRGFGLEGGITGTWYLGCGFSVLGNIGGSLLYNHVKQTQSAFRSLLPAPTTTRFKDKLHKQLASVETFLGLQYSYCYCGTYLELHFGWENHLIFNTNQFASNEAGNLSLQGITIGGRISF